MYLILLFLDMLLVLVWESKVCSSYLFELNFVIFEIESFLPNIIGNIVDFTNFFRYEWNAVWPDFVVLVLSNHSSWSG